MLMEPSFASNMQKGSWMGRPQHLRHREHQHSWKPTAKDFWKPESKRLRELG
jgi:hypothetical protein